MAELLNLKEIIGNSRYYQIVKASVPQRHIMQHAESKKTFYYNMYRGLPVVLTIGNTLKSSENEWKFGCHSASNTEDISYKSTIRLDYPMSFKDKKKRQKNSHSIKLTLMFHSQT